MASSPLTVDARRTPVDRYRSDIEGLRAVAVILVLLYHADIPGFSGGYVGVDVFFVISGFLITGLILRELRETGTLSFVGFYARRARRLVPASILTLAITMMASEWFLAPLRVLDIAGDVAASALFVGNVRFAARATDYLQASQAPSPVLHFWSLGAEEQFYVLWPALIVGAFRWAGRTGDRTWRVGAVIAAVCAISLALSLWLTDARQPWAFFTLPARAWELAVGALIAVAAVRLARMPNKAAAIATYVGLGLILTAGVLLDSETPFPGTAALLPVTGAALVVIGGLPEAVASSRRFLSLRPLRFIGRISYSLYLWHWPILVIPAAALETSLGLWTRVALAIAAIVVASASQRWLEEPFRQRHSDGIAPKWSLIATCAVSIVIAVGAHGMAYSTGLIPTRENDVTSMMVGGLDLHPEWVTMSSEGGGDGRDHGGLAMAGPVPKNLVPAIARARSDIPSTYIDGCHLDIGSVEPGDCVYGNPSSDRVVVLFGDSHSAQWFPALHRLAIARNWRLVSLTKSACPSVDVLIYSDELVREYRECAAWRERAFSRTADESPDLVVISNSSGHTMVVGDRQVRAVENSRPWASGLRRTLGRLEEIDTAAVVIGDTPRAGMDPPVCLSKHLENVLACTTPRDSAISQKHLALEAEVARAAGATFVDPTRWICVGDPCPTVLGRYLVYRDTNHLSTPFAFSLARQLEMSLPRP